MMMLLFFTTLLLLLLPHAHRDFRCCVLTFLSLVFVFVCVRVQVWVLPFLFFKTDG